MDFGDKWRSDDCAFDGPLEGHNKENISIRIFGWQLTD